MSFHETQSAWAQTTLQSTCKDLKNLLAPGWLVDWWWWPILMTAVRWGPYLSIIFHQPQFNRHLSRLLEAPRPPSGSRYPASGVGGGGQHLVGGGQPDLQHAGQLTHHVNQRDEEEEHGQVLLRVYLLSEFNILPQSRTERWHQQWQPQHQQRLRATFQQETLSKGSRRPSMASSLSSLVSLCPSHILALMQTWRLQVMWISSTSSCFSSPFSSSSSCSSIWSDLELKSLWSWGGEDEVWRR